MSLRYEFAGIEGEKDFGLTRTVFAEFIEYPILYKTKKGCSFIPITDGPLLDNVISYSVELNKRSNKIVFSITSALFKSKIIPNATETDENTFYIKMADGTVFDAKNITDKTLGSVLCLQIIAHMLDGMRIDVDIADYFHNCNNCCFKKENVLKYYKLFNEDRRADIMVSGDCIFSCESYNSETENVECDNFVRNTYPNIKKIIETLELYYTLESV